MASYQAGLPASEAAEAYHPSQSSSARGCNPQTNSPIAYAASASRDKPKSRYQQHPYSIVSPPGSSLQSARLVPGLPECPEKDVDTFIGCPIVVLLQHKDFCAVKLQAIEEGTHAIKCRTCPYQTSEPMAMLDHLANIHKRFTDTQYLCQLNSTFMGQKPVCFGVTGYDEMPDGLSDFLDGIYRWDKRTQDMVTVFPCRLCPTCYLTKPDLKTHYLSHQQALLSVNQPDVDQPMYVCRICRQEFQDFISYYDHHTWMRLPEEILPPKKPAIPEFAQKAVTSSSEASTGTRGYRETEAYPRQAAKQPQLNSPSQSASVRETLISYNAQTKHDSASGGSGGGSSTHTQADPLNLSVGQHQMSIVDRALTYPVYQDVGGKQLEQGIVHLSCPYCQAVYKYRHWLAMHLQNIHGVKDKRSLSEALSTSYAKNAANYYVVKTDIPTKERSSASPSSNKNKETKVEIISSETKEALPMPRPDHKILEALKLIPRRNPTVDQPSTQYAHSKSSSSYKKTLDVAGRKMGLPQDEDEGIGEMESDMKMNHLSVNMPFSLQAGKGNRPFIYQPSMDFPRKEAKDKHPKSPRGRPKKGQRHQGKLAALCEELAKRVESQQDKECPKGSASDNTGDQKGSSPEDFVTCDICGKTFKHKNQLWGHKKTHSKIYTCRTGKDAKRTKTKSSRLGRRQNMPNFRDIANGKVPPLSEMTSVAIPEKKKPRNTLGSTKGKKHKQLPGASSTPMNVITTERSVVHEKTELSKKKKKSKVARKKAKALAKIIAIYKDRSSKKKIYLKEGNTAFYPRRFFYRYCLVRRQEKTRRMLADLRQAVLLEIDADTRKNIYECLKCHRYHRYQRRCLQHFQDKHLSPKKQSQKLTRVASPIKKSKAKRSLSDLGNKTVSSGVPTKTDALAQRRNCHYCKTPGFKCTLHEPNTDLSERFTVKTDDKGRTCFSCCTCHKVFPFQSAVLRHLNTHQVNKMRKVPCPSCSFIAKSPLSLAAHSRVHKKSPSKESNDVSKQTSEEQQEVQNADVKPKKAFNCDECKLVYYNFNAFRRHKSTHKDYYPYRCNQCPAYFKQPADMYDHIQQMHTAKNQYRCTKCTYSTGSYTTLLKHERGHEREENKAKTTRSPLWKRDEVMPPPASNSVPGPSLGQSDNAEALDLRTTTTVGQLSPGDGKETENDEKKKEKVKQSNKTPTEAEIIESLSIKFEKVEVANGSDEGWYFCTECSFTTNKQDSYSRHFKMHERAEMLTCEECEFPVFDQQGLEEHMLKAHNKNVRKFPCDMCQYVTSVPERMVRHQRLHKKMTLQCDQCGYRTPEKRFMIRHILTVHEQQRPFSCEKCNYTTAYKHHLKRHYRLHKQQILHCPKCVHCTLDEKLMLQHIQSHKNDAVNVKCDICKREFVNSKSLGIHRSRDHGKHNLSVEDAINQSMPGRQYRCEVSSVKTHRETPLQLHTVSAEIGTPEVYKCKRCTFTTTHQGNITLHMMQEHMEADTLVKIEDLRDVKQCAQCGFCTSKDQLETHMHAHQEKDIYRCEKCDFKTPHVDSLIRHTCEQEDLVNVGLTELKEKDKKEMEDEKDKQEASQEKSKQDEAQDMTQEIDEQEMAEKKNDQEKLQGKSKPEKDMQDKTQEKDKQEMTEENINQEKSQGKGKQAEAQEKDKQQEAREQNKQDKTVVKDKEEMAEEMDIQEKSQGNAKQVNNMQDKATASTDKSQMDMIPVIKTEPVNAQERVEQNKTEKEPLETTKPAMAKDSENLVQESNPVEMEQDLQQPKGFRCQLCQKIFETEDVLKQHVKNDHTRLMVSAQNPFICLLCPYSSCSEKEARRHLGLHNYDQQFKCEYCVFSTTTASSIATHRKVHRSNKRHSTLTQKRKNVCQRVPATLIGNYASGILVDVGGIPQRRYPCKFCGDVFQVAEEWQHHERRHLMVWNMEHTDASK